MLYSEARFLWNSSGPYRDLSCLMFLSVTWRSRCKIWFSNLWMTPNQGVQPIHFRAGPPFRLMDLESAEERSKRKPHEIKQG